MRLSVVEGPGSSTSEKLLVAGVYAAAVLGLDHAGRGGAIIAVNGLVFATFALGHFAVSRPLYRQSIRETRLWGLIAAAMAVATLTQRGMAPTDPWVGAVVFLLLDGFAESIGWPHTRMGLLKSGLLLWRRRQRAAAR